MTTVYAVVFDDALEPDALAKIKQAYDAEDALYEHSDRLLFINTNDLAGTVKDKVEMNKGGTSGVIIQMTKRYMGYTHVALWEWLGARLDA